MKYNFDNVRTKNWRLISYLPLDDVLRICYDLYNQQYIKNFAVAEHDKDTVEVDGVLVPKDRHVHILVNLYNSRYLREIAPKFTSIEKNAGNCFGIPIEDKVKDFRYLWHADDLDKYQYNKDIVITNNADFWSKLHVDNTAYDIVCELIDDVPFIILLKRYGRDFAIHFNAYVNLAEKIKEQNFRY